MNDSIESIARDVSKPVAELDSFLVPLVAGGNRGTDGQQVRDQREIKIMLIEKLDNAAHAILKAAGRIDQL